MANSVLDVLSSHEAFEALMETTNQQQEDGPPDYKQLYQQEVDRRATLTKLAQKGNVI